LTFVEFAVALACTLLCSAVCCSLLFTVYCSSLCRAV